MSDIPKIRKAIIDQLNDRFKAGDGNVRKCVVGDRVWIGGAGSIQCPVCGKERRYSRAYNGHVHTQCITGTCVSWME